jgi:geranylgeranyl pyrophosphate synthase
MLQRISSTERTRAESVLRKSRPGPLAAVLAELEGTRELTIAGRRRLEARLGLAEAKTGDDVLQLRAWIEREGSIEYACARGREHARRAREAFRSVQPPRSIHRDMIESLIDFTVDRDH